MAKMSVVYAKEYTGLKKEHHRRLWRLWLIWATNINGSWVKFEYWWLILDASGFMVVNQMLENGGRTESSAYSLWREIIFSSTQILPIHYWCFSLSNIYCGNSVVWRETPFVAVPRKRFISLKISKLFFWDKGNVLVIDLHLHDYVINLNAN